MAAPMVDAARRTAAADECRCRGQDIRRRVDAGRVPLPTCRPPSATSMDPPDVVRVEEIPTPTPSADQVLVRVHAAAVNRADLDNLYPRWPFIRLFLGVRRPRNRRLGLDAAGVVEAVGPDVTRFAPGDRVFADLYEHGSGALAEYVCAPQRGLPGDAGRCQPRGRRLPPALGRAGHPGPASRAADRGRRRTGAHRGRQRQRRAVRGPDRQGGGRRGDRHGAHRKLEFVRGLGVDHVIDYTTSDALSGGPYDWILDVDGNVSMSRARRALRPRRGVPDARWHGLGHRAGRSPSGRSCRCAAADGTSA